MGLVSESTLFLKKDRPQNQEKEKRTRVKKLVQRKREAERQIVSV